MNVICDQCSAKKFSGEAQSMCCSGGKIKLEALESPPMYIKQLLTEQNKFAKHFRSKMWKYSAAFMMTSFGADKDLTDWKYFTTYKVQGQCYHRIGSLLPLEDNEPMYTQVYFLEGNAQSIRRCELNQGVEQEIILELQARINTDKKFI